MIVTWVTLESSDENEPTARYAKHGEPREFRAIAERTYFVEDSTKFHVYRAAMRHLEPDTVYGICFAKCFQYSSC